ncbi:ATP-binding protein [Ekhidna sp.]|uniref:PAS domain-containing sensor histidine kinase n=1 Tax=Ekhidna sp. TaxID=2608089 RepID=UPI003B500858
MNISFSRLAFIGTSNLKDPLDFQRVLFINILSILGVTISLFDSILLFFEELYLQCGVTFTSFLFYGIILFLNKKEKYRIARILFLIFSLVVVLSVTLVAYEQGRFNETENVIIALITASYFLLENRLRLLGYWIGFAILIGCKFLKQQYLGGEYDFTFWLTLQNISILCIILFFSIDAFRRSLMKAIINLKEKDEVLFSMIDNVPLHIALLDKDKRYKMVNHNYEKSFRKNRDEIIGSHVRDILTEDILKSHDPMIDSALKGESPEFLELISMPDGSQFYAAGKYMPIEDDKEDVIGVTVFLNDVTKREVAKNKLQTANSTKDKLFSIVAHDIRGPLDLFEGLLDLSTDGSVKEQDFLMHQKMVRAKLTGLKETVNTLLEWARTQLDGVNSLPQQTDVKEIVYQNIELYKEISTKKNIEVDLNFEDEIQAWVDPNHLKIAIRNMIHNALKFTTHGGRIAIAGRKEDDKIGITIKDSGIGMNQATVDSILKMELQNSNKGTSGESGTGLGLSLSLDLLRKNDCTVNISSEPNNGTEIKILTPLKFYDN